MVHFNKCTLLHVMSYIICPMRQFDGRHLIFHVLIALYFIWLLLYASLIGITLYNLLNLGDAKITRVFLVWIAFNLFMGTVLFIVIRLYREQVRAGKFVLYSYSAMALLSVATILLAKLMA